MILFGKIVTYNSIKRKFWSIIVHKARKYWVYPYIYRSYWHYKLYPSFQSEYEHLYYSACPNPGAGIGHQMANWIAGYWWAQQFGLKFAHLPFSTKEWDEFLGFGCNEVTVNELRTKGYKVRKLPMFRENAPDEVQLQKDIISSYSGQKVVFVAEQDQSYKDQYGVMEFIQRKFYSSPSRKNDLLDYSKEHFNIALHARRGDIMVDTNNSNLAMRYLSNDYFYKVLTRVLDIIKTEKEVHIYFFSQGTPDDFPEFKEFKNLHWCLDMSAQQSFLHMVFADLLITSKSSFSYKPALLNKGVKVCPQKFWHSYPKTEDWILCDDYGYINENN